MAFWLTALVGFLLPNLSLASEHWYLPGHSASAESHIEIRNTGSASAAVWISGPVQNLSGDQLEELIEVPANSILPAPESWLKRFSWVRIKTYSQDIHITLNKLNVKKFSGNRLQGRLWNQSVLLLNLSPFPQEVSIIGPSGISTKTLNAFESLETDELIGNYEFTGPMALAGFKRTAAGFESLSFSPTPLKLNPIPGHYFLVSDSDRSESFVVRLDDEKLVQSARAQIANPQAALPRILNARVEFKPNNHNRNFSSGNRTTWSWHVAEVYGFRDFGSQWCNGSPEMVEELLNPFIESGGVICFWSFRVVKELSPSEVSQ